MIAAAWIALATIAALGFGAALYHLVEFWRSR